LKKVLFVCVHNSGRSQMAGAFLNHLAKGWLIASSAGIKPASRVDPTVVKVMLEAGIDIRDKKPKLLTFEMIEAADRVVTMGCGAEKVCPASFVPTEDWELTDPKGKPVAQVRQIRDEIKNRVEKLIEELS
jgi:arsenate reductase